MELSAGDTGTPLGETLRGRRRAAGLTQQALADAAGLSVGVVRDVEQGVSARPRRASLERLAAALGLGQDGIAGPSGVTGDRGASGHALSLHVLGPLAAWRNGAPVPLGGGKQRAILGLLAAHPGSVVSQDAIVDVLWDGEPPPTAAAMIQSHISRLRGVLDPGRSARAGGALLQAADVGYRLQAAEVELDLLVFQRLAEDARVARRDGDSAGARELFERALGLWRGEPLVDVALLRGHPAVVGLTEQWADVVVEYAETASAAGWHDPVLPHLHALARRDPLNERAHACLMIALAGSGHQAAALEVYEQARRRLDDQLGVRPGAGLAEAHMRVLRHDIPAAAPGPGTPGLARARSDAHLRDGGGAPRPFQLPPVVADFTGRSEQLARLQGMLGPDDDRAGVPVVVISGPPGVGKTALMVHAGHVMRPFFPDGQLWAQLDGASRRPRDPGDMLGELLRALGVPGSAIPGSTGERAALFRTRLADQRVLIVADDAASAAQVRPLLPGTAGCAVMVTSRRQLAELPGARLLPLGPLTLDEVTELLGRIAGRERVTAEPQAAGDLASGCGHLPLAVRIAGAKLAARPSAAIAVLAKAVADERNRLDALRIGDLSVRASLASGYQALSGPARRAFRLLGLLGPCDVAEWVVAALLGAPDAGVVVDELCDRSMLTLAGTDRTGQARFRLHDLLRDYACEELESEPEPQRRAATERAHAGWLQLASMASARLPREPYFPAGIEATVPGVIPAELAGRLTAEPVAWFAAERLNLLAAVESACTTGGRPFAEQLATYQAAYHQIQDRHDDAERIWSMIATSAQRAGDGLAAAHAQVRLGAARLQRSYSAAALDVLDQCVQVFDRTTNADALAIALYWRAVCAWDLDDFVQSQRDAERGVALAQQAGNRHAECMNLRSLAETLAMLGHGSEALRAGERALAIAGELGDESYLAVTLHNLAVVCARTGQCERAVAICQKTLGLCRKMGDARLEALTLGVLGDAFHGLGRDQDAIDVLSQALPVFREHAIPRYQALCMFKLGRAYQAMSRHRLAVQYLEESLPIFRQLGLPAHEQRAVRALQDCRRLSRT